MSPILHKLLHLIRQQTNSLYIIQFVTSIELLHVSALWPCPQAATEHSFYPPKRRNIPDNRIFMCIDKVEVSITLHVVIILVGNSHNRF